MTFRFDNIAKTAIYYTDFATHDIRRPTRGAEHVGFFCFPNGAFDKRINRLVFFFFSYVRERGPEENIILQTADKRKQKKILKINKFRDEVGRPSSSAPLSRRATARRPFFSLMPSFVGGADLLH